jgi:hypothetical protein
MVHPVTDYVYNAAGQTSAVLGPQGRVAAYANFGRPSCVAYRNSSRAPTASRPRLTTALT